MANFQVKIRSQWQASSRAGNQPGNRIMCHITSQYMGQHDYMEQHDVRPLLRSVCIADSYIRGHFTLFHTGDGYFTFLGWLFYILGKKPPRSLHTRAGDRLHIYCNQSNHFFSPPMRSLCFFLFCALYEQEVSEINIQMVSQSRTPLTPFPSTTSIISDLILT